MTTDPNFIAKLESVLKQYVTVVQQSPCKKSTKRTYILHSRNFARWVKGDFEPGSTLNVESKLKK